MHRLSLDSCSLTCGGQVEPVPRWRIIDLRLKGTTGVKTVGFYFASKSTFSFVFTKILLSEFIALSSLVVGR